jgi:disulfide bond formation protein DsbB
MPEQRVLELVRIVGAGLAARIADTTGAYRCVKMALWQLGQAAEIEHAAVDCTRGIVEDGSLVGI